MNDVTNKAPVWFLIVAGVAIIWNAMGSMGFVQTINMAPEAFDAMTGAEQDMYNATPMWSWIANGVAVFLGLLGSIGLIMRRKWSRPLLALSFLGVVVAMLHTLVLTDGATVYGSSYVITMFIVLFFAAFLIWLANYALRRYWLK